MMSSFRVKLSFNPPDTRVLDLGVFHRREHGEAAIKAAREKYKGMLKRLEIGDHTLTAVPVSAR